MRKLSQSVGEKEILGKASERVSQDRTSMAAASNG